MYTETYLFVIKNNYSRNNYQFITTFIVFIANYLISFYLNYYC